jgi:hypothetical protein
MEKVIFDSDWALKFGVIIRTNNANTKEQAEEGAIRQVSEDTKALMEKGKELAKYYIKPGQYPTESKPEIKEEIPVPKAVSYQLNDGKWFTIAESGVFGFKVVVK